MRPAQLHTSVAIFRRARNLVADCRTRSWQRAIPDWRNVRHGDGVPQDRPEAARWYRRAAELDHRRLSSILVLCILGRRVSRLTTSQAYKWMTLASTGQTEGAVQVEAIRALEYLSARMTEDQIDSARALAGSIFKPVARKTLRVDEGEKSDIVLCGLP